MSHTWPIPALEYLLIRLAGKHGFATIDLCQEYWYLPLATPAHEYQIFITPDWVFSPTKAMQGQRKVVAFFQSYVQLICEPLRDSTFV